MTDSSQPSILANDTPMALPPNTQPILPDNMEELERILTPYTEAMESIANEFGFNSRTVFTAVAACHGDLEDARRFLLHDFAGMKRPPLSISELTLMYKN